MKKTFFDVLTIENIKVQTYSEVTDYQLLQKGGTSRMTSD